MNKIEFEVNQQSSIRIPISYIENRCICCYRCVEACSSDVLYPNERGLTPIVMYPNECTRCGACIIVCPKDAIELIDKEKEL